MRQQGVKLCPSKQNWVRVSVCARARVCVGVRFFMRLPACALLSQARPLTVQSVSLSLSLARSLSLQLLFY